VLRSRWRRALFLRLDGTWKVWNQETKNQRQELRGHLEAVACNLCGSERQTAVYAMPDRRYFREEFFTVTECDECGLGFVNPRPTIAEMQKYYPQSITGSHPRRAMKVICGDGSRRKPVF